jgi:AraC-like DNA-binding protein
VRAARLPGTCDRPRLWLWPGHALYVGPSLDLEPHSGAVSCLAVAVDGTFTVAVAGDPGPACRSALIAPRTRHRLVARSELMAFCYVDPGSPRHRACRRAMTEPGRPVSRRHRHERALAGAAPALDDAAAARAWLDLAAGSPRPGAPVEEPVEEPVDPRIRAALRAVHDADPQRVAPAAQLAAAAGLSPSRFLHLFRAGTGTSFRRYRTWLRMVRAADVLRRGGDLTTAAADAGFASPSHFSDAVLALFGLRPHRLLGADIRVAVPRPARPRPGVPAGGVTARTGPARSS